MNSTPFALISGTRAVLPAAHPALAPVSFLPVFSDAKVPESYQPYHAGMGRPPHTRTQDALILIAPRFLEGGR